MNLKVILFNVIFIKVVSNQNEIDMQYIWTYKKKKGSEELESRENLYNQLERGRWRTGQPARRGKWSHTVPSTSLPKTGDNSQYQHKSLQTQKASHREAGVVVSIPVSHPEPLPLSSSFASKKERKKPRAVKNFLDMSKI